MEDSERDSFVPADFQVPATLECEHFRIRMLTIHDVVKDYDAVMSSLDHLRNVFGPGSSWPSRDLTLEQNLIDLAWHQKEFQRRTSFAYTVVSLDENRVLGCLYLYPSPTKEYDVMAIMWIRASALEMGLDEVLFSTTRQWLASSWPFKKAAYPGREISWDLWGTIT